MKEHGEQEKRKKHATRKRRLWPVKDLNKSGKKEVEKREMMETKRKWKKEKSDERINRREEGRRNGEIQL